MIFTMLQEKIVFYNARILIIFCNQNPCNYNINCCIDERSIYDEAVLLLNDKIEKFIFSQKKYIAALD